MKISILLPYKENFSPTYPGAVSLMVKDTSLKSIYRKKINVVGFTEYKKKYDLNYFNIKLNKKFLFSTSKEYLNKYIKYENKNSSDLIEIHNRPGYLKYLSDKVNSKFVLYLHNDPLVIKGSRSPEERINLLKKCEFIIVISKWIKKQFIKNIEHKCFNLMYKFLIIPHSVDKPKKQPNIKLKKKNIVFVGRLNHQKGYDLFGQAIIKILNEHKDWKALIAGDEPRQNIFFSHKNLKLLGFVNHNKVLQLFEKSSIAVVPSRWEEPLGRTGFESSSRACAPIISNKGGLPETITNGIILKRLNVEEIYKFIKLLILNDKIRNQIQKLSYKNFKNTTNLITKKIDNYRNKINKKFYINLNISKNLKILHITNFNERFNGRLHYNTGKRINNGFIRNGHNVLTISDRDILHNSKKLNDPSGLNNLNKSIIETANNFKPNLIVLGHADGINRETIINLKKKDNKICQWFLDPLNINGPDYNKNKKRISNFSDLIDATFLTTNPSSLRFNLKNSFFIPNPSDESFETLNNFSNKCDFDVFFAMSHGVHRGKLKKGKYDERELFVNKLIKKNKKISFDIYGMNNIQPIWANNYLNVISNSKMGLNLSRGKPMKYYSSDRITQIVGNGLVTLIDEETCYRDFFNDDEMVFYNNLSDLSEKINKISLDERLRRKIGKKGKKKYMKYFNSKIVTDFMIKRAFNLKISNVYWNINN